MGVDSISKVSSQIYQKADLDHSKVKFGHTVLNGFSVIEEFNVCKRADFGCNFRADFMSIFIVTGGQGVISLNMEDIQIKENSLIHISPNMLLGPLPENQSLSISGLSFTTDFIAEIGLPEGTSEIFSYFSSKFFPVWNLIPEDAVLVKRQIRLLVEHIKEYAIHPYGKEILIHGFYIFMFEIGALARKYTQMTRLNFSRQESLVIKFSNLAQQQFREVRTVKTYADQLNISAKYLTEVVKEYSGKNASEIINDLVILEAKFLLSKSQLSIGEIAERLNFSDQSFFGKYFKRQTGLSPKAFREADYK